MGYIQPCLGENFFKAWFRGQNWTVCLPAYLMRIKMCLQEFGTFVDGTFKRLKADVRRCFKLDDVVLVTYSLWLFSLPCCFKCVRNMKIWFVSFLNHGHIFIQKPDIDYYHSIGGYRQKWGCLFVTFDQTIFLSSQFIWYGGNTCSGTHLSIKVTNL